MNKNTRNLENVQFSSIRQKIDPKYNDAHDELTECYYAGKEYKTYGVLTKEQFDKLHGLIFMERDVEFHEKNQSAKDEDKISEDKYNNIFDSKGKVIDTFSDRAKKQIQELKKDGFVLNIK